MLQRNGKLVSFCILTGASLHAAYQHAVTFVQPSGSLHVVGYREPLANLNHGLLSLAVSAPAISNRKLCLDKRPSEPVQCNQGVLWPNAASMCCLLRWRVMLAFDLVLFPADPQGKAFLENQGRGPWGWRGC